MSFVDQFRKKERERRGDEIEKEVDAIRRGVEKDGAKGETSAMHVFDDAMLASFVAEQMRGDGFDVELTGQQVVIKWELG